MLPWVIPRPHRDGGSLYCFLGWRIGKGEGYADLEYAMMVSMGAVSQGTPVVTIVHDCQVLPVNGWQSHWHTPLRGRRGGRCGERGGRRVPSPRTVSRAGSLSGMAGRPHPGGFGSERCQERGWSWVPVGLFTHFCWTRSSTSRKHSLRITTSPWTISSLQRGSSPRGVSAQSQRESRGPRWVTTWHRGPVLACNFKVSLYVCCLAWLQGPDPAWLYVRTTMSS